MGQREVRSLKSVSEPHLKSRFLEGSVCLDTTASIGFYWEPLKEQ